jgi:tRNA (mo5U34)-methyltransferase
MQERIMKLMPLNADEWGFSDEDILHLETISKKRADYLAHSDVKGKLLSGIVKEYSALKSDSNDFCSPSVRIGRPEEIDDTLRLKLRESLLAMWPWRKGPFEVFGIDIDCEWKSDLKWDRVIGHLKPLNNRHILDIGSSNGYYMFRMLQHNPAMVMGIEPYTNFYYQFMMLNSIAAIKNIFTLPLKFEDTVSLVKKFNTIFCMGILYHRKSPIDFLSQIKKMLTADGELVLETLIIEGETHTALIPEERYAKMPNVYFIPTIPVLLSWLKKAGFKNTRCVDISVTTIEEQRKTEWINTETLADFLDPQNCTKTIEGYPAPVRAVIIAGP